MSPGRVDLEPAYILHTRAYRETSQIIEVFTGAYGRLALVAKGARRPKSPLRGLLNPFQPMKLSWSGRGEMPTLREADTAGPLSELDSSAVMSGFYVNELLLKLLERSDPHPDLFAHYAALLADLLRHQPVEPLLRKFELHMLHEIGYALNLERDAVAHEPLNPEQNYEFVIELGAMPVKGNATGEAIFSGDSLLAIGRTDFAKEDDLRNAKRLLRAALNYHLGNRSLHTRRVASAMKRSG
jgi:DNA repair protein RecO (recombination protein O)